MDVCLAGDSVGFERARGRGDEAFYHLCAGDLTVLCSTVPLTTNRPPSAVYATLALLDFI